jgi:hypothetical protein
VGAVVVKPRHAWTVPVEHLQPLGHLRHWRGVEVLSVPPRVWLRAIHMEAEHEDAVRRLPGAERYTILDDGQLVPAAGRVPCGHLPSGPWQPLADWLRVELPVCDDALALVAQHSIRLVRSVTEREPTWLRTSLAAWTAYAVTAPLVRLAKWTFVADRRGDVLIRGAPLPPLPGMRLVERDGIVVPVGWEWTPALAPDVLRQVFSLGKGDALLWTPDGESERIRADDHVQASRSAARFTASAASSEAPS